MLGLEAAAGMTEDAARVLYECEAREQQQARGARTAPKGSAVRPQPEENTNDGEPRHENGTAGFVPRQEVGVDVGTV